MTRKVRLTITGIQTLDGQEDRSELKTLADYYDNGGKKYLFYTEDAEDGGLQSRCRLTIGPEGIELKKELRKAGKSGQTGQTGQETSVLTFREGMGRACTYQTPVGPMELTTHTGRIDIREDEDHLAIYMEYRLSMGGEPVSDHRLHIKAEALMLA